MEENINIAAILKDKPQGTKLYDLLYNIDVELDTISTTDTETVVWCTNETDNNTTCHRGYSEFGTVRGCSDGLRILLPSKEMRDWSKFDWKKGDVLSCGVDNLCIFEKWANEEYTEFYAKFVTPNYSGNTFKTEKWSKETNEAVIKQYISNIEEFKGGKLNLATLEIEKQPEFKDGDIVYMGNAWNEYIGIIKNIPSGNQIKTYAHFHKDSKEGATLCLWLNKNDSDELRPATDSEKQQLFEALAKEGKRWDAKKKAIVDLKPKAELKPFDKVLVRDRKSDSWRVNLFGCIDKDGYYRCVYANWVYCIPYIGNESLLGTTKDVEG